MEYLKFFIFAAFLFCGILAQRFQRHLNITNDTQNGILIDGLNNSFSDIPNELVSDELSGVQEGDNVRLNGYGGIKIELSNGKLEFEICSDGCIRKKVVVCYDAQNIDSSMKGECESNQCEFQAGVLEADKKYLWFMSPKMATSFTSEICETAILKSPKVIPSFATTASEKSCEPLKRDGNVVQLFVKEFGCSLKVKNAKIWSPTTPSATTPSESAATEDPSKVGSIVWIILGILLFILVIGFIVFGIYCFCTKKQKKPATIFDEKPKEILAENKKIFESQKIDAEENVENGKSKEPKESVKTEKERTEEKQEIVEEKLVKKDVPKKQKKVEKPKQKTTKIKIEDIPAKKKATIEPTLDEATTEASIVQKPKEKDHSRVSKELILPVPKSYVKKIKPKEGASTKTDSLSGRHEVGMQGLVESPSESLKLHDDLVDARIRHR